MDKCNEKWQPAYGYEGYYSVSDQGRVRRDRGGRGARAGTILKQNLLGSGKLGYYKVALVRDGTQSTQMVHRLVAESFIGPCPDGMCVNHKDGIKTNNVPGNLEYVTLADNNAHAAANNLTAAAEDMPGALLSNEEVRRMREMYAERKTSQAKLAAMFGVSQSLVSAIVMGKRYAKAGGPIVNPKQLYLHMSEKTFMEQVRTLARMRGWREYHTMYSRGSNKGFPDLVLLRPPRLIAAELKTQKGKTSPEQEEWLRDFKLCAGVETFVWRPSDWTEIEKTLK